MAGDRETASLTDALVELSFVIQATLTRLASERGMSLIQVRMLGILRDREPGIVELAGVLRLEKSSVSGLVDRAQRRGLVARAASEGNDGRAIRVILTQLGQKLASEFATSVAEEIAELLESFSSSQRRQLAALAARVVASSGMADGLQAPRVQRLGD